MNRTLPWVDLSLPKGLHPSTTCFKTLSHIFISGFCILCSQGTEWWKIRSLTLLNMVLAANSDIFFHTIFNQSVIRTNCKSCFSPPMQTGFWVWRAGLGAGAAALPFASSRDLKLSWAATGVRRNIRHAENPWTTITEKTYHKRFSLGENHKIPGSSTQRRLAPSLFAVISPSPAVLLSFQQSFERE